MSQKSTTPDERFLIHLYHIAQKNGNLLAFYPVKTIAQAIGQKQTAAKQIVRHLAQANLVKKEDDLLGLTQRGIEMIEQFFFSRVEN